MQCTDASRLISSYLDGELSEAQAAPLRKHLLACQRCRAEAQGEKNLKRWFVTADPVAVPEGFAARVARRAFGAIGDINILMVSHGASTINISFLIDEKDATAAIQKLHADFFGELDPEVFEL